MVALYSNHAKLSFGDAVYYYVDECNNVVPISQRAHPQNIDVYIRRKKTQIRNNYLLENNIFLGAATLFESALMLKYLEKIVSKVIYAEDNIYRLMIYNGIYRILVLKKLNMVIKMHYGNILTTYFHIF